ncbi:MAG: hypothetical protein NVV72_07170 [Asticcacaulis sp.]|nr:hypothetical protein [Asticcacaulis sp.]
MPITKPEHLIFEREVGGVDCELTVSCKNAGDKPVEDVQPPAPHKKPVCELTPDQQYICDHATD